MAVLMVLVLPLSETIDIQGLQKIYRVTQVVTPLITEVLPLHKIKIGLSAPKSEKNIFWNFPLYSIFRYIDVDLFN